jgi:hypothetical protein
MPEDYPSWENAKNEEEANVGTGKDQEEAKANDFANQLVHGNHLNQMEKNAQCGNGNQSATRNQIILK